MVSGIRGSGEARNTKSCGGAGAALTWAHALSRVQGAGCRVQGSGFRVQGEGFTDPGFGADLGAYCPVAVSP